MKIKALLFCTLFCLQVSSLSALSISFQIMQIGTPDIEPSTYELENAMFDYFFSNGVIISNSQSKAYVAEGEGDFNSARDEARLGGAEYFAELISVKDAPSKSSTGDTLIENIRNVSWNVVNLKTGISLGRGNLKPPKAVNVENNDEVLSNFSKEVAEQIYEVICFGGNL